MTSTKFQLKLKQTLQLNQAMQQSLRVLQMSGLEVEREVEDWLADNPLLERRESEDWGKEPHYTANISSKRHISLDDDDSSAWENLVEEETLNAYLHKQVSEHPLSPEEAARVHVLIDFLDDKGYLTESIEEIIDHTPLEWMLDEDDMELALEQLREFDPPGIATTNLQQSLLHQLDRLPLSAERRCAAHIVVHYLDNISQNTPRNINKLSKLMPDTPKSTIEDALEMISSLRPYPAYGFAIDEPTAYVRPDVFIESHRGEWVVVCNDDAIPQIQINPELSEALQEIENDAVWREKMVHAKQKIDMLQQRKSTIMRVAEYIVERQQDFFTFGEIGLVPMLIKDCASALELAESTISRAVNSKYLACPQGLFALRYFFSQNAIGSNQGEDGISGNAIRSLIAQMVDNEDKTKPLSDTDLHQLLQQQGITIARRTVAKYREQLGIPTVQQRRQV
ncbi:RNA polymerase factor sigma-54 [Kingella kingae]|uniref:RNA polymerase factor sigma-54 n=1 Tax=Kingella kingae TaxID=504 RepID=UPI000406F26A|nr:RNA polymerase factor sigma-54 [Kingella kingae]MDK4587042.1 RNA polymerase factor sigma-54 [Kingella kingae]MDK4605065.1 RNA polymerase factor sigma-54 [Kingella kingae]MDK4615009.1 RNA polymerase factor sigma-54 [Kingella kingae]MDK4630927.1 RNA polymerase factor sigma-54 [Kingella kingae]MDK4649052.1 RNA polymerase factor sigma-54 [Kingella kingae]